MFTFPRRTRFAPVIAALTLLTASSAFAAERKVEGTVESVDYTHNSITIIDNQTGEQLTRTFRAEPKVRINGRARQDMALVQPGQQVLLKLKTIEPPQTLVKGEILEINREQNIALVRPADGGAPRVIELPAGVVVSGLHTGADVADLQEGYKITLKYTAR